MAKHAQALMTYCIHALPGLEQIAWLEVRQQIPNAEFVSYVYAENEYGGVVFRCADSPQALFELRTIERLFAVALWQPKVSRGRQDLREMQETLLKSGEIGWLFNLLGRLKRRHLNSYQVVGRKYGKHQYSQRDWSKMVRGAVESLYPDWRGTTTNPDIELWATLFGSQALIGARLPIPARSPLHTLSAALVLLTEPSADDRFLDPLCSDGGQLLKERFTVGPSASIRGAKARSGKGPAKPDPSVQLLRWREGLLPVVSAGVDKMATILPPLNDALSDYAQILTEMARLLAPNGIIALYCQQYEAVKEALREVPTLQISSGYSVRVGEEWGRVYLMHGAPA